MKLNLFGSLENMIISQGHLEVGGEVEEGDVSEIECNIMNVFHYIVIGTQG